MRHRKAVQSSVANTDSKRPVFFSYEDSRRSSSGVRAANLSYRCVLLLVFLRDFILLSGGVVNGS